MTHRVFISYSTKDKPQADCVAAALEAAGVPCWIAPRDIPAGESWPSHLIAAIKQSEMVLLLYSANSNASADVFREINHACKYQRRILSVRIDNTRASGDLEYFLAGTQWFDAFERSLDSYMDLLLDAVQKPGVILQGAGSIGQEAEEDANVVEASLREIEWRLAELEDCDGPLSCSSLDDILEPATDLTTQMRVTRRWEPCSKIYLATARGLVLILDSVPTEKADSWPAEIEYLQLRLHKAMEQISAGQSTENIVALLHRLFAEFLDRVPAKRSGKTIHRVTLSALMAFLVISGVSLALAYYPQHTTTTWEVRYAFAYGPNFPRLGAYLEFSRSVLLLIVAIYLFEVLLRAEFERLLLDWSRRSWRRPWVKSVRLFGCVLAAATFWTVCDHVLSAAPSREANWAETKLKYLKDNPDIAKLYPYDMIPGLQAESAPHTSTDHARPYRWYLPYCLVNYTVYAALLLTLSLYAILSDHWLLIEERDGFDRLLANQRLADADIDRKFFRFYEMCIRHTQRYITLLIWVSIVIFYESIVTRKTMSEYGWRYELMTSAFAGLSTLIWVGLLVHFYEGAFQRCCSEKRRRHGLTETWERKWNTTRFLSKSFLNLRSGVAIASYLAPIIFVITEVTFGRH